MLCNPLNINTLQLPLGQLLGFVRMRPGLNLNVKVVSRAYTFFLIRKFSNTPEN